MMNHSFAVGVLEANSKGSDFFRQYILDMLAGYVWGLLSWGGFDVDWKIDRLIDCSTTERQQEEA